MAARVLYDALVLVGSYDMSSDHNQVSVDIKIDTKEITAFSHTEHRFAQGIGTLSLKGDGWAQYNDTTAPKAVDFGLYDQVDVVNGAAQPITVAETTADQATAFFGQGVGSGVVEDLRVAECVKFTLNMSCAGRYARGVIALPRSAIAATNSGTITQLGAVSATQRICANIHVPAFTGTSLVMRIKSNASNTTAGATTRLTFTTVNGVTSEYKELIGPFTDTFWFADWTTTAATGTVAVAMGIR